MKLSYITCASGRDFIKNKSQYAVKSLLRCGISNEYLHVVVNTPEDESLFKKLVPDVKNI